MNTINKTHIYNLYRITFTGSRESCIVIADNFGEAAKTAYTICFYDNTPSDVISITYVDVASKLI